LAQIAEVKLQIFNRTLLAKRIVKAKEEV